MARKINELTSLQHPLVKHLVRVRQNHDYRMEHQSIVLEGKKLVSEVCPVHHTKVLLSTDPAFIPPDIRANETFLVTQEIMQKISGLLSPEGLLAEVNMPTPHSLEKMSYIVALDGINDPGNLGTLIRTALALGWEGVFILNDCCDPYNDKAIRAAKGATFRLPLATGSWEDLKKIISANKLTPIAADMNGRSVEEFANHPPNLLVLSNEARGLSEEAKKNCQLVKVPMQGNMESLNVAVAGGILMYELIKKIDLKKNDS